MAAVVAVLSSAEELLFVKIVQGDSFEKEELLESVLEEKVVLLSRLGRWCSEWRRRSDRGRGRW